MAAAADWADLLPEIVLLIAGKLEFVDIIRLRAVCGWWAWALGKTFGDRPLPLPSPPGPLFRRSPLMIIPNAAGEDPDTLTFLSLSEDRRYKISPLPEITGRRVMGSSPDGWLVTVDLHLTPRLLNPFTRQELPLPSLLTLPNNEILATYSYDGFLSKFWYQEDGATYGPYSVKSFRDGVVRKIILPNSCSLKGGVAIALITLESDSLVLAFASVGDEVWLPGPNLVNFDKYGNVDFVEDVIYREGEDKFYAVTNLGSVFILQYCMDRSWEVVSMVSSPIENILIGEQRRYIFFSSDELLQVTKLFRCFDDFPECRRQISDDIKIFKFDHLATKEEEHPYKPPQADLRLSSMASCWVPVNDLGDISLFVGSNHSFFIHCDAHHELGLLKRNRVYFGDDNNYIWQQNRTPSDIGVFNLEINMVEFYFPSDIQINWPPPVFFMSTSIQWDNAL